MFAPLLVAAAAASHLVVATSRGDQSLTIYPPAPSAASARAGVVVLVLSGEGGWRAFDEQLARWLSEDGYWVGGFDCLHYFWTAQDDRAALAVDVKRLVDALARAAGSKDSPRVLLAGYSFGADLAPWIAGASARDPRIAGLIMIGPDRRGSLEFRITELMGMTAKNHVFDTASALADAKAIPVLFVHGAADDSSDAPALAAGFTGRKQLAVVPSATHHFAGHEAELRRVLVESIPRLLAR